MKLRAIAQLLNGTIEGDPEIEIVRPAKIEEAQPGDITFVANPKYARFVESTQASAIIVSSAFAVPEQRRSSLNLIRVADPYAGFTRVLQVFAKESEILPPGIHPSAVISKSASIGDEVRIGAHVFIGERVTVGARSQISHNVVLGDDVVIGEDVIIYPQVTIRERCRIGNRVILHPGVVIGSDGFGFAPTPEGSYEKIPQLGIVVIEDDVEIGSNTTVDRATIGETRIKRGAKLDNLIQVAHNVVIGEHTVIAAQTGISGSTKIGAHCVIGGQVGFVGHIEIADHTTIGAQSGVSKSIKVPGKTYFGYPAKEYMNALRQEGALRQLPELILELRELRSAVKKLLGGSSSHKHNNGETHVSSTTDD